MREASEESAEERRGRESAREVTEWETAFAAAKNAKNHGEATQPPDADLANAGAMVSRAHRAEKNSARRSKS